MIIFFPVTIWWILDCKYEINTKIKHWFWRKSYSTEKLKKLIIKFICEEILYNPYSDRKYCAIQYDDYTTYKDDTTHFRYEGQRIQWIKATKKERYWLEHMITKKDVFELVKKLEIEGLNKRIVIGEYEYRVEPSELIIFERF